jgi:hypothetical protein
MYIYRGGFHKSWVHSIKRRAQLCLKLGIKYNKLSARCKCAWYMTMKVGRKHQNVLWSRGERQKLYGSLKWWFCAQVTGILLKKQFCTSQTCGLMLKCRLTCSSKIGRLTHSRWQILQMNSLPSSKWDLVKWWAIWKIRGIHKWRHETKGQCYVLQTF